MKIDGPIEVNPSTILCHPRGGSPSMKIDGPIEVALPTKTRREPFQLSVDEDRRPH